MNGRVIFFCAGAVLLCVLGAEAQRPQPLSPGDVLFVDVKRRPELSTSGRIDAAGNIDVPFIGPVNVGGLSEGAAAQRVAEALGKILREPEVSISRNPSSLPVGTRDARMITETIALSNANAENLSTALEGMTTPGGSIGFDPDTNTLIVTDTADAVRSISAAVSNLDGLKTQLAQVSIETKIAEVEEGALKEIGVRWFVQGNEVNGGFFPPDRLDPELSPIRSNQGDNETIQRGSTNFGSTRRFVGGEDRFDRRLNIPVHIPTNGQVFFGLLNDHIDLGAMLDALVTNRDAELLANPMILTTNHKTAQIKMTDEFPFSETVSGFGVAQSNTKFLDIGIILDVTPHIHRDDIGQYVKLHLRPEVSFLAGIGANGVPIRSVRSSESMVSVRDGQTLVIGGVFRDEDRKIDQGVPFLSKIPVVKYLFKRKENNQKRSELVMFVTPNIHESPEQITLDRMLNISPASAGRTELGFKAGAETTHAGPMNESSEDSR